MEENTPVLQLTEEQLQEFKELFDSYDTQKTGKIGVCSSKLRFQSEY